MSDRQRIGNVGNCYGGLEVKKEEGLYYWGIDNYDEMRWREIDEKLYDELIAFEERNTVKISTIENYSNTNFVEYDGRHSLFSCPNDKCDNKIITLNNNECYTCGKNIKWVEGNDE